MKTQKLTTRDNLIDIIGECLEQKWDILSNEKMLRLDFVNKDKTICRSARIESLRTLPKEMLQKIICRKYVEYFDNKGNLAEKKIRGVYINGIFNDPNSFFHGVNLTLTVLHDDSDDYDDFLKSLLTKDGKWPQNEIKMNIVERNFFGDIICRYPILVHGGNGYESGYSCLHAQLGLFELFEVNKGKL